MTIPRREFLATAAASTAAGFIYAGEQDPANPRAATLARWRTELARHRIVDLQTHTVQMRWPRLVGRNARLGVHGRGPNVTVCRIRTDRGATGWGAFGGNQKTAARLLQQHRKQPLTRIFDPATGITNNGVKPLDFALHDLAGQILRIPVYEMLGSNGPRSSPCYSGMIYFDDLEPRNKPAGIGRVLQNCRDDVRRGYRQLKVKIGRGNRWMERQPGIRRDIEVVQQIAKALPDVEILVDGNNGYTAADLITFLEGIGDIQLFWIEEPFHENVADYRRIRQWLRKNKRRTLLADGEARPDTEVLEQLQRQGLLDVRLEDIQGYGFTAWRRLMPQLRKQRIQASPHAWGHILKTYYISHLARGLGNVVTIEGVTCTCEEVDFGRYRLHEGQLTPSPAPGFGMTLNVREE